MTKPGGLLVYQFQVTTAAPVQTIQAIDGAPSAAVDFYGHSFRSGVIKGANPSTGPLRTIAVWAQAFLMNPTATAIVANVSAIGTDAAGLLTSLILSVGYANPPGLGALVAGYLFVSIPNTENVGL